MTVEPSQHEVHQRTHLKMTIVINKVITMHYFEYGKNFVFNGERHNFWEFLYVDRGEIEVMADETRHLLKQGTIIFHKPNEFHSFYATRGKAPNLVVMTFDCHSKAMERFANQVLHLEDEERNLLTQIVKEGENAFHFPFGHPLKRHTDAPIGSEQLIKCYLEIFLVRLLRKEGLSDPSKPLSSAAKEKNVDETTKRIIDLLAERMDTNISLDEISHLLYIGKTQLKDKFKKNTGHTIIEYFSKMKIEQAKLLMREEAINFTEISQRLGFSSVHYFSKAFKKTTSMSPSEYARTVKARLGDGPSR
ncbi:AraC family transcriptional regulator [Paenibacillus andongensis]|uniref:AraC family transcriptional regulator n=1 Tax=Paenibacillus andongensis TaxID=2975482 RepID=UPI0021BA565C|nr:AraC family transcriptional regulator [Paenibacillus andongensis]